MRVPRSVLRPRLHPVARTGAPVARTSGASPHRDSQSPAFRRGLPSVRPFSRLRRDTMASADFSLRRAPWGPASPFQASGEISPGKTIGFRSTTARSTPPPLGRWSFAVICPLAPEGSASYPVPVRRPAPLAPRFLQTPPHENALALRSGRCDLLPPGLAPGGRCPCWAHTRDGRGVSPPSSSRAAGVAISAMPPGLLRPVLPCRTGLAMTAMRST